MAPNPIANESSTSSSSASTPDYDKRIQNLERGLHFIPESHQDQFALEIRKQLYNELKPWARELILSDRYSEPADPYRAAFAENPNDPLMHAKWHQWGIILHSVMTGRYFEKLVPGLLQAWFGDEAKPMLGLKQEKIDNLSKWDLLLATVPTHDFGKFTRRQYRPPEEAGGKPRFSFKDHEAESGAIVNMWRNRFKQLGLTDPQVDYMAACASHHYDLGKLRDHAKQTPAGYTIAFTHSVRFGEVAASTIQNAPDLKRELGVFFIADSLGKTDIHTGINAATDEENESRYGEMESEIKQRGLRPDLLIAARQMAVNMAAAEEYLILATQA